MIKRFKEKTLKLNESYMFVDGNHKIINISCYESYMFPTTLDCIEKSLKYFVKHYKEYGINEIAFPLLGCDAEGLRMVSVLPIMEKYLKPLPIECYICFDIEGASNLELQMIEAYKTIDLKDLQKYVGLDDIQLATLKNFRVDIQRFSDIYHLHGIDAKCYRGIYEYFYNGVISAKNEYHSNHYVPGNI